MDKWAFFTILLQYYRLNSDSVISNLSPVNFLCGPWCLISLYKSYLFRVVVVVVVVPQHTFTVCGFLLILFFSLKKYLPKLKLYYRTVAFFLGSASTLCKCKHTHTQCCCLIMFSGDSHIISATVTIVALTHKSRAQFPTFFWFHVRMKYNLNTRLCIYWYLLIIAPFIQMYDDCWKPQATICEYLSLYSHVSAQNVLCQACRCRDDVIQHQPETDVL